MTTETSGKSNPGGSRKPGGKFERKSPFADAKFQFLDIILCRIFSKSWIQTKTQNEHGLLVSIVSKLFSRKSKALIDPLVGAINRTVVEHATNGTFDSDVSGWSAVGVGSVLSHATDKARITKTGANANSGIEQDITKPTASTVNVRFDVVIESGSLASGNFRVRNLFGTIADTGLNGSGSANVVLALDGVSDTIQIYGFAGTCTFTLDNVSITST